MLVSATIGGHKKLLALPSHRARWGWIVMLGQAKLRRPPGRFASLNQARFYAGEFRDLLPAWMDAGLLHAAAAACPKCLENVSDLGPDEVVVHDWKSHQERSRTSEWRDAKGVGSGHQNLARETDGETTGKQRGNTPSRAPTRALQSQSQSSNESNETSRARPEDWDCLDTYYSLTRWRPWGIWSGEKLTAAANEYGDANVTAALEAEHAVDADRKTILDRALARLARDAERTKRAKPKLRPIRPARDEAAIAAAKRELYGGGAA